MVLCPVKQEYEGKTKIRRKRYKLFEFFKELILLLCLQTL